jgi:hypothetical protein
MPVVVVPPAATSADELVAAVSVELSWLFGGVSVFAGLVAVAEALGGVGGFAEDGGGGGGSVGAPASISAENGVWVVSLRGARGGRECDARSP